MLISLLENNRKLNIINIHVLDNNISFENKERLKEIVSNNASIYFYELSELLGKLDKQYNIPKTISISAYARLFLSDILDENISKILYVDCDALFMDSLEKLWSIDISQNSVAGVLDHVGIQNKLKIGLKKDDYYIILRIIISYSVIMFYRFHISKVKKTSHYIVMRWQN